MHSACNQLERVPVQARVLRSYARRHKICQKFTQSTRTTKYRAVILCQSELRKNNIDRAAATKNPRPRTSSGRDPEEGRRRTRSRPSSPRGHAPSSLRPLAERAAATGSCQVAAATKQKRPSGETPKRGRRETRLTRPGARSPPPQPRHGAALLTSYNKYYVLHSAEIPP